ncbi:MAG TPA: DUF4238 domain-containing protein [Allosphingosinicella sp.]|jgi:hypothetical protein|nr:DUF4238 domain-containing protein [Allosphingosinicella sp.]
MPANKNQHFVPQSYLRLFNDGDERQIDVLPLSLGRIIRGVSLRDQASRPWFYDQDGTIERELAKLEGSAAGIIRAMLARDRPPKRLSSEHQGLIMFLALQLARTQAAADAENERADKLAKLLIRRMNPDNPLRDNLDLVRVTLTHPVHEAMRMAFLGTPLLYDLKLKLIVNASSTPFVASDAPAILHNHLCDGTGTPARGYASIGLQIILPLGPWRALLCYDGDAYAVGSPTSNVVRLLNSRHADLVNDLQWEAARHVLFVPPCADEEHLISFWDRWRHQSREQIVAADEVIFQDEKTMRTRLGIGAAPSAVDLSLPFVRPLRPKFPAWTGEQPPEVRHPEWVAYVGDLIQRVDDETLHPARFVELTLKVPRMPRRRRR